MPSASMSSKGSARAFSGDGHHAVEKPLVYIYLTQEGLCTQTDRSELLLRFAKGGGGTFKVRTVNQYLPVRRASYTTRI